MQQRFFRTIPARLRAIPKRGSEGEKPLFIDILGAYEGHQQSR
jgi:hypothetical protein